MFEIFLLSGKIIFVLMLLLWLLSLYLRDSSIVDPFWGTAFVILAFLYYANADQGDSLRKLIVLGLTIIWGLRLSLHLLSRNRAKGEDPRYARWRAQAGPSWWWRSLYKVFLLQGLLLWIISLPLLAAQYHPQPPALIALDIIALLLWLTGFFFETLGDWQLVRFQSDPRNQTNVLNSGLWRYTRHPNYFGEVCIWWAFGLLAVSVGAWWALLSPLLLTFLLLRISGITMLESDLKLSKPGYAEYIRTTSAFFPRIPSK
jgi:steroid 5-alpha reductase family enzyme